MISDNPLGIATLSQFTFRHIQPAECGQIVKLHRNIFLPEQVARTIYASSQVEHYLANLIALPILQGDQEFWGAWDGEILVGYAHFRALPESWHLNNVAVLPAYQGCGIGRALWAQFINIGRQRGYTLTSLDVKDNNLRALNWYQRQGLQIVQTVRIYEKPLHKTAITAHEMKDIKLLNWEQAEAWQLAYGFSQFQLIYQDYVWTVGRLGQHYFRVSQLLPEVLERVLLEIDPTRRLLIFSSTSLMGVGLEEVGISYRMQGRTQIFSDECPHD